jgi:hypothetical protein
VGSNQPKNRRRPGRVLTTLWVLVALAWLGSLAAERTVLYNRTSCELASGSSVYGTPGWEWIPPGRTCMFKLDDSLPAFTTHPGAAALAVMPTLLVVFGALDVVRRRETKKHRGEAHASSVTTPR